MITNRYVKLQHGILRPQTQAVLVFYEEKFFYLKEDEFDRKRHIWFMENLDRFNHTWIFDIEHPVTGFSSVGIRHTGWMLSEANLVELKSVIENALSNFR